MNKSAATGAAAEPAHGSLSPCDTVLSVFDLGPAPSGKPLVPTHKQRMSVDTLGETPSIGCWDRPGTGKTLTMTLHALHAMCTGGPKQWVVLTPPAVIVNWTKFLRAITVRSTGKPLQVLEYLGAKRGENNLRAYHFIAMSYEVFKRDYERLTGALLEGNPNGVGLICDEGHKVKNLSTANYRHVKGWQLQGVPIKLATGTPLTSPLDIFAYTRFKNPDAYRNLKHFYDLHVAAEEYEKPTKWRNLEVAREKHMENSTETLLSDVRSDLPAVSATEWVYDLEPKHLKLYDRLAEEQIVRIEETGAEITALTASALWHRCQQLVLNLAHFSGDEKAKPAGLDLALQWLDELGEEKLMIVANYQMSNTMLQRELTGFGAQLMYGPMTHAQKMRAKDTFIQDPASRVLVVQPEAGGVGVDGLQHVCHSMLFLEVPVVARQYHQAVARLDRIGQSNPVQVRIAAARGTVQMNSYSRLLANDDLLSHVQRTLATLREMIHGVTS